jgi:hypothetical protein
MLISIDLYTTLIPTVITALTAVVLFYIVSRELRNTLAVSSVKRISEYVTLRCPTCGYVKVREFKVGDYVGKVDDEKCPRDGSNLVIMGIGKEQVSA